MSTYYKAWLERRNEYQMLFQRRNKEVTVIHPERHEDVSLRKLSIRSRFIRTESYLVCSDDGHAQ